MVEILHHAGPLNELARHLNGAFRAARMNLHHLIFLAAAFYLLRDPVRRLWDRLTRRQQQQSAFAQHPRQRSGEADELRRQEMMRVRAQQQEVANERAREAARKLKERQAQEKERRNHVARSAGGGTALGTAAGGARGSSAPPTTGGYNPMQPWSGASRGYRPARRTVRRG